MRRVLAASSIALGFLMAGPALAGAVIAPKEDPKQAEAILDLSLMLADPPPLFLKADLQAPRTVYFVVNDAQWLENLGPINKRLKALGLHMGLRFPDHAWDAKVSCGAFDGTSDSDESSEWFHPNGPPPECSHAQGTNHPGTVSVTGKFAMNVTELQKDQSRGPERYAISWTFDCTYLGSDGGKTPCKVTLVRPGEEPAKAAENAPAAPPPNAPAGMPAKNMVPLAGAATAAGIGGAYLYWRKFLAKRRK